MSLRKTIFEKARLVLKYKAYEVEIPKDIDKEIEATMRELGMSEKEIRQALFTRNINS